MRVRSSASLLPALAASAGLMLGFLAIEFWFLFVDTVAGHAATMPSSLLVLLDASTGRFNRSTSTFGDGQTADFYRFL